MAAKIAREPHLALGVTGCGNYEPAKKGKRVEIGV
jgi:hypothetical protein